MKSIAICPKYTENPTKFALSTQKDLAKFALSMHKNPAKFALSTQKIPVKSALSTQKKNTCESRPKYI